MSDIDPAAVMAAHGGVWCACSGDGEPCEPYLLAEQMQRWQWEHALANDGCVPGAAYRDLAAALAVERAKVARAEATALFIAEQYGRLLAAHEQVVMDTPEDRELHARVIAAFRSALPGLDAALADQPERALCDQCGSAENVRPDRQGMRFCPTHHTGSRA